MNILAVDTSSDSGSVAISSAGELTAEIRLATSIQHSDTLFDSLEFLFAHSQLSLDEIDLFAAARGPGSFTGLRVGLAAMEAFAFAKGRATAGVSTLKALAWQVDGAWDAVAAVLDARRGEVYAALYQRTGQDLVEVLPPGVLQPAQWFETLPQKPIAFCGEGALDCRLEIEARPGWKVVEVSPFLASAVAAVASTSGREPLEPLYVRRTSAEVDRDK